MSSGFLFVEPGETARLFHHASEGENGKQRQFVLFQFPEAVEKALADKE